VFSDTIPITLVVIANQIVCVCAYLTNFKPVLVPPHESTLDQDIDLDSDVEDYFAGLSDREDDVKYYDKEEQLNKHSDDE